VQAKIRGGKPHFWTKRRCTNAAAVVVVVTYYKNKNVGGQWRVSLEPISRQTVVRRRAYHVQLVSINHLPTVTTANSVQRTRRHQTKPRRLRTSANQTTSRWSSRVCRRLLYHRVYTGCHSNWTLLVTQVHGRPQKYCRKGKRFGDMANAELERIV